MSNNLDAATKEKLHCHVAHYLDGLDDFYWNDVCRAIEAAYILGLEDGWNNGKTK